MRSMTGLFMLLSLSISLAPQVISSASPRVSGSGAARVVVTDSEKARSLNARDDYSKLPLSFEQNMGQSHQDVKFLSRGKSYALYLTSREAVLTLVEGKKEHASKKKTRSAVLRMKLLGGNANPRIEGQKELPGKVNHFIGNNRNDWRTDVPTYREVHYEEVWPGIDVVWYGNQRQLEYDFVVHPGADPKQIKLGFAGADKLRIEDDGRLVASTKVGEVEQHAPAIYQETENGRQKIAGKYILRSSREVGFEVNAYDPTKSLIIDPILVYSTFLGGADLDNLTGVAVNSAGEAFVTGSTESLDFPIEGNVPGQELNPGDDPFFLIFVTKLNAAGSDIVYSTFIRGQDRTCVSAICGLRSNGIAVTSDGKAAITGLTLNESNFSDFPVTDNAYQGSGFCIGNCTFLPNRHVDAFVTVLNPAGNSLFYSTFFGGTATFVGDLSDRGVDIGKAIAVDSGGRVYITGQTASNDFPIRNAFQIVRHGGLEENDAFVAVFNPAAPNGNDSLLYSSYLGGNGHDFGESIAVDANRNAYVGGRTESTNLETKSPNGQTLPPLQESFQGGSSDGFVAKVDTASSGDSSLTYLTYFGGSSSDRVEGIAVDAFQRAYITGATGSSSGFPIINAFDSVRFGNEAFVAKLNADGTALFYSSYLGGTNIAGVNTVEEGNAITIDAGGNAYIVGRTEAPNFPVSAVSPPFLANLQGKGFLAKIEATVSTTTPARLLYSTTFGGDEAFPLSVALDAKGNVYFAGTADDDLPTTAGAFQTTFQGGGNDGFIAKVGGTFNDTIGVYRPSANQFLLRNSNTAGPSDISQTFGIAGDLPITGDWDGNGIDDGGVFRPSTGQFLLRQNFKLKATIITLNNFGQAGDLPVAGDWNGDGIDTVGVFRPSTGQWILTNGPNLNNTTPPVNFDFVFGQNGDAPIVGDWNFDNIDTPGLFRGGISQFILSNGFQGTTDITPFTFGQLGSVAMAGDWNGDGVDTVGVFNPGTGLMSLNNVNAAANGVNDFTFAFGLNGDFPLGGEWDGKP
jgi:hypothetical protein